MSTWTWLLNSASISLCCYVIHFFNNPEINYVFRDTITNNRVVSFLVIIFARTKEENKNEKKKI